MTIEKDPFFEDDVPSLPRFHPDVRAERLENLILDQKTELKAICSLLRAILYVVAAWAGLWIWKYF